MQPPKRGSSDAAEAYYAALLQGAGGHRDARFRPVFVVGLPRSGSTLIEQILASHSQVRCQPAWAAPSRSSSVSCRPVAAGHIRIWMPPLWAAAHQYRSMPRAARPSCPAAQVWGAGEDTALAPLLPELLAVLNSRVGAPCATHAVVTP